MAIPIHEVHVTNVWDKISEGEALAREFGKLGLYGPQFAYSVFREDQLDLVLRTGTFHRQDGPRADIIDCYVTAAPGEPEGIWDEGEPLTYYVGLKEDSAAPVVVYERDKLCDRPVPGTTATAGPPWLMFAEPGKKLEALVAIVRVRI